jgi:hypothetical protein
MFAANDDDEEEARESRTALNSRTRILILKTDEVKSKIRRPFSRNKTLGGPRFLPRGNKKRLTPIGSRIGLSYGSPSYGQYSFVISDRRF